MTYDNDDDNHNDSMMCILLIAVINCHRAIQKFILRPSKTFISRNNNASRVVY